MVCGRAQTRAARLNRFSQQGLLDWRLAFVNAAHFFRINVHAENFKSTRSQSGGDAGAKFSQAEYRNFLRMFHEIEWQK